MAENAVHDLSIYVGKKEKGLTGILNYVEKFLSDEKTLKSKFKKDLNLQVYIKFSYSEKAIKLEKISHF